VAVVDVRIRLIGAGMPLNVLVQEAPPSVVAVVEEFPEPPTEIYVLVRNKRSPATSVAR
jgi:hypothetical protein